MLNADMCLRVKAGEQESTRDGRRYWSSKEPGEGQVRIVSSSSAQEGTHMNTELLLYTRHCAMHLSIQDIRSTSKVPCGMLAPPFSGWRSESPRGSGTCPEVRSKYVIELGTSAQTPKPVFFLLQPLTNGEGTPTSCWWLQCVCFGGRGQ